MTRFKASASDFEEGRTPITRTYISPGDQERKKKGKGGKGSECEYHDTHVVGWQDEATSIGITL